MKQLDVLKLKGPRRFPIHEIVKVTNDWIIQSNTDKDQIRIPNFGVKDGFWDLKTLKTGIYQQSKEYFYPEFTEDKSFSSIEVNTSKLIDMLPFVGKDELRPQMTNVFIDSKNKYIVATNAYILKFDKIDIETNKDFLIKESIIKLLPKNKSCIIAAGKVENDKDIYIKIECEGIEYIFKECDNRFPNWQSVIPTEKYYSFNEISITNDINFKGFSNFMSVNISFDNGNMLIHGEDTEKGIELKQVLAYNGQEQDNICINTKNLETCLIGLTDVKFKIPNKGIAFIINDNILITTIN